METDPTLDWVVIGLESGGIMIYDVDRDQMSDIRIENLQKVNSSLEKNCLV